MAISNTASRNTYTLDAVTTDFDITFDCVFDDNGDATELTVWLIDSEGNRTEVEKGYASNQYTVSYKTVTYLDATTHAGETLLISRATPRTQETDFVNNGAYNLNQVEAMSDKLTRIVQEQDATIVDRIQTSEEFAEAAAESADNAYASEQKAHDWADKAPDVEVETGEYSAKHWASKASQSSGSAAVSAYDASVYAGQASSARGQSASYALESEGWANGEQSGVPVSSDSPYYHYNSKYWADVARQYATGGLHYIGVWTITSQTDYSGIGTPRALGDLYYCQGTACTIDGVTYTQGDFIIFNQDVDDGDTITTSMIDKIDNTESVTPDNTCALSNKTIAFGSNTMTDVASTNTTQTLTNKTIAYDDNTLTGVQPTLTAGTGIDITGTTISAKQTYSTSEVKTGDVWIDGKPIYRQVVSFSVTSSAGSLVTITVATLANVQTLISLQGNYDTASWRGSFPYRLPNPSRYWTLYFVNGTSVVNVEAYAVDMNLSLTGYAIIEYTKTTD